MSSAVAFRSDPTTTRSASLNVSRSSHTNRDHDLSNSLSFGHQIDADRPSPVSANGAVGTGIVGILYKWVNYGRGWKRRWFVLQDGVLSYYKIHGPDKISLAGEMIRRSKVIGGQSMQIISRHSKRGDVHHDGKPVGEIHLKIASIRQSESDDERFSVFTGTNRLHLRAGTHEDRTAWLEALQAAKDMFPRMSNAELMAPMENALVCTDKLRQRLMQESLNETAIEECQEIMRNEFAALRNQLAMLKEKQCRLMDMLKNIEVHARKPNKPQQRRSRNLP